MSKEVKKKSNTPKKPYFEPPLEFSGANWNENEDPYTQFFYEKNLSLFW